MREDVDNVDIFALVAGQALFLTMLVSLGFTTVLITLWILTGQDLIWMPILIWASYGIIAGFKFGKGSKIATKRLDDKEV